MDDTEREHTGLFPLEGRPPIPSREQRDRIAARFPPAPPADERSLAGRLARLKRQANGREPFVFDEVMELAYRPGPGLMFIDNTFVEHDGRLWNFHIVGSPEDLEKADPRIRKLGYEYTGYAVGAGLFDLEYRGLILSTPQGEWDCVATGVPVNIHPYADGFACVTTGVGMQGTRCGVAFSTDLLDWRYHERNPVLPPPAWAEPYGACKDSHILRIGDTYYIYYIVTARIGYSAIALATTTDWDHFELAPEPVFLFPAGLRGTGGCESPCVLERDGVFHLFFCNGPGTWHTISDRPDRFPGTNGIYLVGPFVAAEVFRWNGRWWLSSTRKEDLRRKDRLRGISHHGDVDDERRNLAGMYVAEVTWDGDFPVLSRPDTTMMARSQSDR